MCVILYDVLFQNQHILDQLLQDPGIAEALTPKVSFDWLILTQISISPLVLREQTDYSELNRSKSHACLRCRFAACDLQLLKIACARRTTRINMHIHAHKRASTSVPR